MRRLSVLSLALLAVASSQAASISLWDNGGFVTHPGGGSGGADASSIQSGNLYGVGIQAARLNHAADDFQVPANTRFRLRDLELYLYQTGSGLTSTITSVTVRIWDGVPGGGGNVIYDSGATNLLTSSTFTNAYRVAPGTMTSTNRPIMKCVASIPGGFLVDGGNSGKTLWVSYQANGTLSSGPWAVLVSINGETGKAGANGRQFINTDGVWSPIVDDGAPPGYETPVPQDLAFGWSGNRTEQMAAASYVVVEGEENAGDLNSLAASDDNYLSFFNDSGTLGAEIRVTSAPTNNTSPSKTTVVVEHSVARGGLSVQGRLKNKNTGNFDLFFGATATTSDVTNTIVTTNPNYVQGSGEVELSVKFQPINDESPAFDGWLHQLDLVRFETEP
ncbi:MAG: hypothetical protein U0S12_01745 [Fimbriimonadales bacterium]